MCHACHAKCRGVTGVTGVTRDQNRPKHATQCHKVPRLPRKTKVDVAKCCAGHVKRRWMSPSATPATQSAAASPATNAVQARHQSQPSAISATPATQNEGGCHQVPRLPRETKVDVTKCHAKCRERWCVRKMCVRDGERWCVKDGG